MTGNGKAKAGSAPQRRIRYAVVGLGYISQAAVLPAFAHAEENSELVALVSGDPRKLETLSKQYGIPRAYSYEQYADCLESKEIDAVYIALPNHMHRSYAESAAKAGIHVLCEKPMATNSVDCEVMIEAAQAANVKLMIAYRLHFEAANLKAIKTVKSGVLGEPRVFNSIFSMQVKPGNIRLRKDMGGGPLRDLGIYCINAARYLFEAEPVEVFATDIYGQDPRFSEVPESTSAAMVFPGDRLANFTCSFGMADRSAYEIVGTKGVLKVDPAYELSEALVHHLTIEGRTRKKTFAKRDQFAPELVYFSHCILRNKEPEPSGMEGLADVKIIEALQESASSRRAVTLSVEEPQKRPSAVQEIRRPPVQKPQLVKAAAPSRE